VICFFCRALSLSCEHAAADTARHSQKSQGLVKELEEEARSHLAHDESKTARELEAAQEQLSQMEELSSKLREVVAKLKDTETLLEQEHERVKSA
jgi:type II secretory pathway component PulK